MPTTSPSAQCARPTCGLDLVEHKGRRCPGGGGHFLVRRAVSQSFSAGEVDAMAFVMRGLLSGEDVRVAARHPSFASAAGKVGRMKLRAEGLNGDDDAPR